MVVSRLSATDYGLPEEQILWQQKAKSGVRKAVEDKVSILGEVDMGGHRMENDGKAILTNSLLFSAEAWSNVTDKDKKRLEQVDTCLLK